MVSDRKLPVKLRDQLKKPFGEVFTGKNLEPAEEVLKIIQEKKPQRTIAVGDISVYQLFRVGAQLDISIFDGKVMREKASEKVRETIRQRPIKTIKAKNQPSYITRELWTAIEQACNEKEPVKICVEGEEDLAVLPATLISPRGSLIIYGQPNEGLVVVFVDEQKRKEAREIWNKMEVV